MNLEKHERALADVEHFAQYYTKIDFPNLAKNFRIAADSIRELINMVKAVERVEERKDDTQI